MDKKVSLIMPVYNSAPYLDFMFDSILKQTYDNIEVIVAYDDSNDGTLNILKNWVLRFHERGYRYKIVRNPSRAGIVNGINTALPYLTGDYVTFPDSDDYMLPEFVATMVDALEKNPTYNWARCDNWKVVLKDMSFDEDNVADFNSETEYNQEYDYGWDERFRDLGPVMNFILYTIPRAPWRMMCRVSFLKDAIPKGYFFPHPSSHELPIALPLAAKEEFLYVPKPLYKYTIHTDGYYNSRTKNIHQMIPYMDSMEQLAIGCIDSLDISKEEKEKYLLANSLYYAATKAFYSMAHRMKHLAEIYANSLNDYIYDFSNGSISTEKFPSLTYWRYYFRLAPKIATKVKLDEKKERFSIEIGREILDLQDVNLYGAGENCSVVLDILDDLGVPTKVILDRNAEVIGVKDGHRVCLPNADVDKERTIIITVLNKNISREIKAELKSKGFINVLEMEEADLGFKYGMLKKYFPDSL